MLKDMVFLSFARIFGDKYGKTFMETGKKNWNRRLKTSSKRVVQKTAEETGDFIGSKIVDKITSAGNFKRTRKKKESRRSLHSTRKKTTNN